VNYDNSLVVTITLTCNSWAPSSGDYLFSWGPISRPLHSNFDPFFTLAKARELTN